MTDEWRIASLSQTIEDDDDEDEENELVPSTPGQEDIDLATPSQDSTSLLGVVTDSHGSGRRKLPHSLSLGLPEDPESESLPFLALEWDSQLPVTPAQENGHSTDNNNFLKGKADSSGYKDDGLASKHCNGQSETQPGCSALWGTKSASETCVSRGASESGNGEKSTKSRERKTEGIREGENVTDEGGGGGERESSDGEKEGEDGGDGNSNGSGKERKQSQCEDEESSHEPSSDSSEGLYSAASIHKQMGVPASKCSTVSSVTKAESREDKTVGKDVEACVAEMTSSQRDLFASQEDQTASVHRKHHEIDEGAGALILTPATTMPILQMSQAEEEEECIVPSPEKFFPDTPSSSIPSGSSHTLPPASPPQSSPTKRKRSDQDNITPESEPSQIPFKLRRTEDTSETGESGEDRVIVDYSSLTHKDVEISPKQQKLPLRTIKPPHLTGIAKCLTFKPTSFIEKVDDRLSLQEQCDNPPRQFPVDTEEESSGQEEKDNFPRRLLVDTEEESSCQEERKGPPEKILHSEESIDSEVKFARRSLPMPERMNNSPEVEVENEDESQMSDKDSDIEIIEDKDRSIEVVYEKPKNRSLDEEVGSQDFSLMLTCTQPETPYSVEQAGQRFSQEQMFLEDLQEEENSPSLLPVSEPELQKHHDKLSSSKDEEHRDGQDCVGSMPATQLERICKPVILTQPDITPLINLPISGSTESKEKISDSKKTISSDSQTSEKVNMKRKSSNTKEESPKNIVVTSRIQSSTTNTSCIETSQPSQVSPRLQMPDICTPTSQDYQGSLESESMFVKASRAAKERIEIEEKRYEDKIKEGKESTLEVCRDSSYELSERNKGDVPDTRVTEQLVSDCNVSAESSSSTSSIPVSSLIPSHSSQSTPVSSHPHRKSSQNIIFGSGKKEGDHSTSTFQGSPQVIVEETDSEDESPLHRKRKKLRLPAKTTQPLEKLAKAALLSKTDERKTSTPNTSQGISPNISGEGASYIDKEAHGALSGTETSKSHNTSPERGDTVKSPASIRSPDRGASTPDTEILPDSSNLSTVDDLMKSGYKAHRRLEQVPVEYIHPLTGDAVYVIVDGNRYAVQKLNFHPLYESGSGSSGGRSNRTSDISTSSCITGSSGYFGDKSSSSSNSSRRASTLSGAESSRLSLSSVLTLSSPPRVTENIDLTSHKSFSDDGIFVVPVAYPRSQATEKGTEKYPKTSAQLSHGFPPEGKTSPESGILRQKESPAFLSSDNVTLSSPERRGRGRSRGRSRGRGSNKGSNRGTPSRKTPRRGEGRGRGQSRAITSKLRKQLEEDDEYDEDSPEGIDPGAGSSVSSVNEACKVTKESGLPLSVSDLLDSLPAAVWKMLESSQVPLSEEEEEVFVGHGGADAERQLAQVLKRVREAELEAGLLVFARFIDNNFYSAVLKERDGADRWHVQFTLDQYTASVREVYLLPTDLLPRGQTCYVRHQTDNYSDPGVVKGHIRVGATVLHIVESDRGVTQRVPHSHLLLTGSQAHDILQARLAFRSLVASPGRDVSLDNIVAGRRRRIQPEQFSSPRSRKVDENLDSSDATAGESEEFGSLAGKSPSSKRAGPLRGSKATKRIDLSVLQEEIDSEAEDIPLPVTPKGRRRPGTPRSSRTPRTPQTPQTNLNVDTSSGAGALEKEMPAAKLQELPPQVVALQLTPTPVTPPKKRGRPPGQNSSTQTPKKLQKVEEDVPVNTQLGPLPPVGSQLFEGFTILMTSGDTSIKKRQNPDDEGLPPFDKVYMTTQITRGGGRVLEKYSEAEIILAEQGKSAVGGHQVPSKSKKKGAALSSNTTLLLISNTHCRTAKFIQCLAAGIPIVSFQWVISSCHQEKVQPWQQYLLPAGELESGELTEQNISHEEGIMGPRQLLTGERIFLATSTNREFSSLWQPLLDTTGAKVRVKPARSGNLNRVLDKSTTVVVGDSSIPEEELRRAEQLGIPIVSTQWVIQSLIAGKRFLYSDNPTFQIDLKESTTGSKLEEN